MVAPSVAAGAVARVLVADDNADMREYLVRLLRTAGYEVDAVNDGQQALERVRAEPTRSGGERRDDARGWTAWSWWRHYAPTPAPPPCRCSCCRREPGQEASIEGLHAGADDYLVKPFAAAELLARVRANVELARLRNHHARWRTALVDSLQEAFFVCDERGAVIEINAAFTDILGFGTDGLPYEPIHPWWPVRRHGSRGPPTDGRGLRRPGRQTAGHRHGARHPSRRAPAVGDRRVQPRRRPGDRPPASWSAPSATSLRSTTASSARPPGGAESVTRASGYRR